MTSNAVDLSGYPAAPFLLVSKTLDLVCASLQCQNWRAHVPIFSKQLSYKVGSLNDVIPTMMTFTEFLNGRPLSLNLVKEFAFETPSTSLSVLTTRDAMLVLFLLVLCIRAIKSVLLPFFSSLGRRAGRATHGAEWEAHNEIRIVKFGEYVFRLLFHFGISAAGIVAFWNAPWWKPGGTPVLWKGLPFHPVTVHRQRSSQTNLVHGGAERKDVALGQITAVARQELHGHVPRVALFDFLFRRHLGHQPKVSQLVLVVLQENILGFNVQMHHVVAVNKVQRQQNFAQQFVAPLRRQRSHARHFVTQSATAQFRLNVESIVLHPGLVVAHNVKVGRVGLIRKGRQCVDFLEHASPIRRALGLALRRLDGVHATVESGQAP